MSGEVLHEWIEREYEKRNSVNNLAKCYPVDRKAVSRKISNIKIISNRFLSLPSALSCIIVF